MQRVKRESGLSRAIPLSWSWYHFSTVFSDVTWGVQLVTMGVFTPQIGKRDKSELVVKYLPAYLECLKDGSRTGQGEPQPAE